MREGGSEGRVGGEKRGGGRKRGSPAKVKKFSSLDGGWGGGGGGLGGFGSPTCIAT